MRYDQKWCRFRWSKVLHQPLVDNLILSAQIFGILFPNGFSVLFDCCFFLHTFVVVVVISSFK